MTGVEVALIGFALMLLAIFLRIPVAVAMGLTGFVGIWIIRGSASAPLSQLKTLSFDTFSSYSLSIVPMFLLMGQFATKSGMSRALFTAAADLLGHRRGGVAMATVGACAGFGAICGSSLATASTMGQVALPEMRRAGYSDGLATGVLAAGGTLGILIPPSVILVIYAILAEQNIAKMFGAAIVPGLLAAVGYMIVVRLMVIREGEALRTPKAPIAKRMRSVLAVWPVLLIFGLVMGGIAADWNWTKPGVQALFTPTEGAAVGMIFTGVYGAVTGGLTWRGFVESVLDAASASAMIFFILLGAQLFNTFLAFTQAPQTLAVWIAELGVIPIAVLLGMLVFYLVFGCVMDSLSMILLTVPVFFPIIETLDFGMTSEATAIWFGILALVTVEIGLITPPVGLNLFIINNLAKDVPIGETYRGVLPFIASDLLRVGLLVAVPGLALLWI